MNIALPRLQALVWMALLLLPAQAMLLTQAMKYNSAAWLHFFAEHNLVAYRGAIDHSTWCMNAAVVVFAIECGSLLLAAVQLRTARQPRPVSAS